MRYLYRNHKNREVTAHSYSASQEWSCPRRYQLKRVLGWSSRDERSSLEFGSCLEAGLQTFHRMEFFPGSGQAEFQKLWEHWRLQPLVYTASDRDWETLLRVGTELLALYEATYQNYPVANAVFQTNYKKELFPGTEYAGLEFTAFADLISEVEYDHPALPPLGYIPENGTRKVLIDIKSSAKDYFSDPRLAKLDGQLRDYAWVSAIETVAFMVFRKNGSKLGSGETITLLTDCGENKAGSEHITLDIGDEYVIITSNDQYEKYKTEAAKETGKGSREKKEEILTKYALTGTRVAKNHVTKQKIQFLAAVIPEGDQREAGELVGQQAIEIADAYQTNNFPKIPGVRWPNDICSSCDCLGHCIGDEKLVKQRLIQIGGAF